MLSTHCSPYGRPHRRGVMAHFLIGCFTKKSCSSRTHMHYDLYDRYMATQLRLESSSTTELHSRSRSLPNQFIQIHSIPLLIACYCPVKLPPSTAFTNCLLHRCFMSRFGPPLKCFRLIIVKWSSLETWSFTLRFPALQISSNSKTCFSKLVYGNTSHSQRTPGLLTGADYHQDNCLFVISK